MLPGFESSLPGLEIKTLNMNQLSIKHCIANVMMQFDVTLPGETKQLLMSPKASISLIPVEGTESHPKIFKCKTSIVNAMLPAEICSIIPKMVSLLEPDAAPTRPALCSGSMHKTESHLTTISETTLIETLSLSTQSPVSSMSSLYHFSPAVKEMIGGMFANACETSKNQLASKITPTIGYDVVIVKMLPKIYFKDTDVITYRIRSLVPEFYSSKENIIFYNQANATLPDFFPYQYSNCTALVPYISKNKRLATPFQPYDFDSIIRNILRSQKTCIINASLMLNISTINIQCECKLLNIANPDKKDTEVRVNVTIGTITVKAPLCKDKTVNNLTVQTTPPTKCIEYIKRSKSFNYEKQDHQHFETTEIKTNNKNKRKGFYRLYRKCKSTTNIPSVEKVVNTPLSKIQTLEDFFQILGSKKLMSSIFDGYAAKKILSSIGEVMFINCNTICRIKFGTIFFV